MHLFGAALANRSEPVVTDMSNATTKNFVSADGVCSSLSTSTKSACSSTADKIASNTGYQYNERTVFYVTVKYTKLEIINDTEVTSSETQTAQFFPKVDQLTALVVPNVKSLLGYTTEVKVTVRAKNNLKKERLLATSTSRKFFDRQAMVPFRSVIVRVDNGMPVS